MNDYRTYIQKGWAERATDRTGQDAALCRRNPAAWFQIGTQTANIIQRSRSPAANIKCGILADALSPMLNIIHGNCACSGAHGCACTTGISDVEHNPWATAPAPSVTSRSMSPNRAALASAKGSSAELVRLAISDLRFHQALVISAASLEFRQKPSRPESKLSRKALPGGQLIAGAPTSAESKAASKALLGRSISRKPLQANTRARSGNSFPPLRPGQAAFVRRAITQAVVPALASETAGQVYKGPSSSPMRELLAALAARLLVLP